MTYPDDAQAAWAEHGRDVVRVYCSLCGSDEPVGGVRMSSRGFVYRAEMANPSKPRDPRWMEARKDWARRANVRAPFFGPRDVCIRLLEIDDPDADDPLVAGCLNISHGREPLTTAQLIAAARERASKAPTKLFIHRDAVRRG